MQLTIAQPVGNASPSEGTSSISAAPAGALDAPDADGAQPANDTPLADESLSVGTGSLGGSTYLQGVLLATSGLRLPDGDEPVSQLAGAFASVPTAAQLVFSFAEQVSSDHIYRRLLCSIPTAKSNGWDLGAKSQSSWQQLLCMGASQSQQACIESFGRHLVSL